jgi:hypothetical protein
LVAIVADLEIAAPDAVSWKSDDPAFGWTLERSARSARGAAVQGGRKQPDRRARAC